MAMPVDDNREDAVEEAVRLFVDARWRGEEPDVDEFVRHYRGLEDQIRQSIQDAQRIDTLFDSLVQADASDFEAMAAGHELVGRKIGSLEIAEMIGRGGMGVVYLAHDTKLDRSVAVKCIPAALRASSTAQVRLKREAKLLASLNHPNIAVIHDIIEEDKSGYLILEYVPGPTLAQRMARRPLHVKEGLLIAEQIAGAVSAAHEKGVVHRDLKPGNIKITPEGKVKVLDFGLAKASVSKDEDAGNTVTQPGRVMGTPAYMSPEQARGQATDKRSDIWSFGCVLYEMLTGHVPFEGQTATEILARIIERQPDWQALPPETPANISVLLRRCLEKNPQQRLRDIGDACIEIQETLSLPADFPPQTTVSQTDRQPLGWPRLMAVVVIGVIMGGIVTGVGIWRLWLSEPIPRAAVRRLSVVPKTELKDRSLALSPDGGLLAYIGEGNDGRKGVYLRNIERFEAILLSGTGDATHPFFSPDGQWLAYVDSFQGKLKKVSVNGGEPIALAECGNFRGGTWGTDDHIIFAPMNNGGLWRISATGEGLEQLTYPDPNIGEWSHLWPQFLPDGEQVLFTNMLAEGGGSPQIEVYSLRTGRRRILYKGSRYARYLPTGHLVYSRNNTLYAVACDLAKSQLTGPHVPVVQEVLTARVTLDPFTFAQDGSLAYIPLERPNKKLEPAWVTEDGTATSLAMTKRNYHSVSVSPNGAYAAFRVPPLEENVGDLWIYDLKHRTEIPIARNIAMSQPVWMPDSNEVIYMAFNPWRLFRVKIDGTEEPKLIAEFERMTCPRACSPDGTVLLADRDNDNQPMMEWDIWTVPLAAGSTATAGPVIERLHSQKHGAWSPDGHWIAYSSDESGRSEVYVEPYPGPGPRQKISIGGGHPIWSRDGTKLFYRSDEGRMVAATIETGPKLEVTERKELFDWEYLSCGRCQTYDVAPDGRFLMIRDPEGPPRQRIAVILNWFDELKRLVSTGRD